MFDYFWLSLPALTWKPLIKIKIVKIFPVKISRWSGLVVYLIQISIKIRTSQSQCSQNESESKSFSKKYNMKLPPYIIFTFFNFFRIIDLFLTKMKFYNWTFSFEELKYELVKHKVFVKHILHNFIFIYFYFHLFLFPFLFLFRI